MRGVLVTVGVCLLAYAGTMYAEEPGDDLEQIPSCGQTAIATDIWQYGTSMRVSGYS